MRWFLNNRIFVHIHIRLKKRECGEEVVEGILIFSTSNRRLCEKYNI